MGNYFSSIGHAGRFRTKKSLIAGENTSETMLPPLIYGTAWKQEATAVLTETAVRAGFRGIDTANQKKHYREDFVGDALLALKKQGVKREDLFLQSKYTYKEGQDHRLPYNPADPYAKQVKDSFENSLKNLHTDYLDSYLLHGPRSGRGLTPEDWEVWAAMEALHQSGQARCIGVSNVGLHHLEALWEKAKIKPQFVQNRCFAVSGWDQDVREFCQGHKIIYQGFSLLTANPKVVLHPQTLAMARRLQVTPMQIIFRFSVQIGILPLTGTTQLEHMEQDLAIGTFQLSAQDIAEIHALSNA